MQEASSPEMIDHGIEAGQDNVTFLGLDITTLYLRFRQSEPSHSLLSH